TPWALDHFEPYYGVFFALLDGGERILYLDAQEWEDGITTVLQDLDGKPFLLHGWFSRLWDTSHHTRERLRSASGFARKWQGFVPTTAPPPSPASETTPPRPATPAVPAELVAPPQASVGPAATLTPAPSGDAPMVTFETKCWEADWRLLLTTGYLE